VTKWDISNGDDYMLEITQQRLIASPSIRFHILITAAVLNIL